MTKLEGRAEFAPFAIDGQFYDGQTSTTLPAQIRISQSGALLIAEEFELALDPATLLLSDRVGDTPRRIEWQDGAAFVTQDNAAADRLQRLLPGGKMGRLAFVLESNLALAVVSLLGVAILLGSVMFWGVPAGARYLATKIPEPLAVRAGNEVMEALDRIHLKPSTLPGKRVQELRAYFTKHDSFPPRIEFRQAGEEIGPNAFALPGGFVVITDELVTLAKNDEEILAVYLHEVGHARAQHAETSVLANSAWLVILTMLTGDISGMTETVFAVPVMFGNMAFSRELEREADDYSIKTLKALGLSPTLLADILERMGDFSAEPGVDHPGTAPPSPEKTANEEPGNEEQANEAAGVGSRLLDYLSTHPSTDERLDRIRAAAN